STLGKDMRAGAEAAYRIERLETDEARPLGILQSFAGKHCLANEIRVADLAACRRSYSCFFACLARG
ncbi:hypothetical protein, partial [Rhizobium johnstonii]|uniref:hypothetical protein n=1 Tax=Rhizobium johnstonii TaxID=3019933 RepID=UPI003F9482EB